MENRITLSKSDVLRLRVLIRNEQSFSLTEETALDRLQDELDRAYVVAPEDLPDDAVTLESRVLIRDLDTSECSVYTLVCRTRADLSMGELSVLAPLGTALVGYRTGDTVVWGTPNGTRRVLIEGVKQPNESGEPPPREPIAA